MEVKVGSVTVLVRYAPVTVRIKRKASTEDTPNPGNGESGIKTYPSYQIIYYEGTKRQIKRRNTLKKATKRAEEIATRLSRLRQAVQRHSDRRRSLP